ncbi:Na+/H+ antiporter subunit E [Shewanella gelidii]|uniref:Cation transporter n=1 Tax=Shewanella gelidii TaxID=1642821 RepID=A0A917JSB7_9GAMM|nr:Na+/H+ antiporter subunit E [Shewanella gelidii]MCL1098414.1 Na+/H+ antiporter subunit E [Shewanella gelidii]GGI82916.1 cation transporter [Shewanella gelidii]
MRISKWAILLIVYWLLLSGFIQPLLLSFGALSVAIVLIVIKRMDAVDTQQNLVRKDHQLMHYCIWLVGEIFKSSMQVTKLIWTSPEKVSPTVAKIDVKDMPESARVLYANSITLTPGTISVDLEDDQITVHALQHPSIEELEQEDMKNRVAQIWEKST